MSAAVLEIHDARLSIKTAGGEWHCQPGFAQVTDQGIVCGEVARASAWTQPQHSHNSYWRELNQNSLPGKLRWARHNADIAFAQLKQLWHSAGEPDSLIVATAGTMSSEQLALLLGLIQALPARVEALVDSALASAMHSQQALQLLDLHLHQTLLTRIGYSDGTLQVSGRELLPGVGELQLHNAVARNISEQIIHSHRFDPLHSSGSEQQIYNQMPQWLSQLGTQDELHLTLDSERGTLPFALRRDTIAALWQQRLAPLLDKIDRDSPLSIRHGAAIIPAMLGDVAQAQLTPAQLVPPQLIPAQQCADNLLRLSALFAENPQPLQLMQRIQPAPQTHGHQTVASEAPQSQAQRASHLLCANRALPLSSPISLYLHGESLEARAGQDHSAALVIASEENSLRVLHRQPSLNITLPRSLHAGECLQIAGQSLPLIEVCDG